MDQRFYKNKWLMLALVAVVILTGFLLFRNKGVENNKNLSEELQTGEVSITGKFGCLPYKSAVTETPCILGVKGDDGKDYALDNTAIQDADKDLTAESKVKVIGIFEPASTTSEESKVFDIYGVLKVRLLKKG